jgi:hypothetical protein
MGKRKKGKKEVCVEQCAFGTLLPIRIAVTTYSTVQYSTVYMGKSFFLEKEVCVGQCTFGALLP